MLKKSENTSGLFSPDGMANWIGEFVYNPEKKGTRFFAYFKRYDEIFKEKWKNIAVIFCQRKQVRFVSMKQIV